MLFCEICLLWLLFLFLLMLLVGSSEGIVFQVAWSSTDDCNNFVFRRAPLLCPQVITVGSTKVGPPGWRRGGDAAHFLAAQSSSDEGHTWLRWRQGEQIAEEVKLLDYSRYAM